MRVVSSSLTIFTTCWSGRERVHHLGALGARRDRRGQLLDHGQADVRLEQRQADRAHRLVDVGVGELAPALQAGEDPLQLVGERVEHRQPLTLEDGPTPRERRSPARTPGRRTAGGPRASRPDPTSFTGMPSSRRIATAMPPRAVPSSLVRTTPVTPTASWNRRAWLRPFWPVVASSTSRISWGASGSSLPTTARTLRSSSIRLCWVWRRPGRVDEGDVRAAGGRGGDGVVGHGAGVGPLGLAHELGAGALGPDRQLVDGGGAEGVGGADHDASGRARRAGGRACRRWSSCRCR